MQFIIPEISEFFKNQLPDCTVYNNDLFITIRNKRRPEMFFLVKIYPEFIRIDGRDSQQHDDLHAVIELQDPFNTFIERTFIHKNT